MVSQDGRELIQRYERLRQEAKAYPPFSADPRADEIDAELVTLEKTIPEWYTYPGDNPGGT